MRKLIVGALISFMPLIALADKILVLGDSISAAYGIPLHSGWVQLLSERLDREFPGEFQVINASISGDTTAGGLNRLPALLEQHRPDQVLVELGGNDGLRGFPPARMRENLQAIIERSRESGASVVLFSIALPPSYGVGFNRRFQQVFSDLEEEMAVPRVALGFDVLNDRNLLQEDGIHPTEDAQPILVELVWPYIEKSG